jgi:hypothetical protein
MECERFHRKSGIEEDAKFCSVSKGGKGLIIKRCISLE